MLPETLIEYHLGETSHLPTAYQVARLQGFLITLSLAGILYAPPAAQHAQSEDEEILNVLGTCYTAILLCYMATDTFFRQHIANQSIPLELIDVLEPPLTPQQYRRQNWIIGSCALLSAIPFSTTAIAYPFAPLGLFVTYLIYIFIATTILHFLPVKLTIEHPIYGALPRWGQAVWEIITCNNKSDEELEHMRLKIESQLIKQQQAGVIANAKEHFLASLIPALGQVNEIALTAYLNKTPQEKFEFLLTFNLPTPKLPNLSVNSARLLGAAIVLGSCLGYAANPYLVFLGWLDSWWLAALCSAIPLDFFGVLMAYFGDGFGQRILTDIALWGDNVIKLPIEVRLYPKIMTCLILVNAFLLVYASAAAEEMMERAFKSKVSPEVMTFLDVLARTGLSILAWYGPLDFEKLLLKYIVQYSQKNAAGELMTLASRLDALENDVLRLKNNEAADVERNDEKTILQLDQPGKSGLNHWCCLSSRNSNHLDNNNSITTPLITSK